MSDESEDGYLGAPASAREFALKKATDHIVPKEKSILLYFHCKRCMAEKPDTESPQSWGRLEVGWTKLGLQVWCKRHDINIVHIDFQGQKHPANTHS